MKTGLLMKQSGTQKVRIKEIINRGMDMFKLYDYQIDAINKMKTGCVLNGGVGSGKSLTALGYYYLEMGGDISFLKGSGVYKPMDDSIIKDLYIITTARKRDTFEWDKELSHFLLSSDESISLYSNNIVVDSWNNIAKYSDVENAFFIFDEQRVVGYGAWVKNFLKITKKNAWILLSATPGDTWQDYIPVFIANGFYKNKTEFAREHIVYNYRASFPKIDRYLNTKKLIKLRDSILIDMDCTKATVSHHYDIFIDYDRDNYRTLMVKRWDIWDNKPIESGGDLCYKLRKLVNTSDERITKVLELVEANPKVIIFYNFDYELDILRNINYGDDVLIAEWNGHRHQPIPDGDKWVYLVQYTSGCEGWNCISTDTIIFYSQNYSYKVMAQASGRIDRLNTPYKDLYYYHLKSRAPIDIAINRALKKKKNFNQSTYISKYFD